MLLHGQHVDSKRPGCAKISGCQEWPYSRPHTAPYVRPCDMPQSKSTAGFWQVGQLTYVSQCGLQLGLADCVSLCRAWHLAAAAGGAQTGVFTAFSHIGGNSKWGSWGALEVRARQAYVSSTNT